MRVPLRHLLVGLGLVAIAGAGVYTFHPWRAVDRTLRIGFQISPPYHFPDAQGNPTGPVVEIVRLAARRRNVQLQWVFSPEGPEKALASGAVDLWPMIADLPERDRKSTRLNSS